MAKPGYGKRSAPDQLRTPPTEAFALLPGREQHIAAFIDRLPEGASMSVKTLARQLPLYGQQAVSTALTALSVAGHLRRVRCLVGASDQVRWVFRTYWSRTAHDNEWWATHLAAETAPAGLPPKAPISPDPVQPAPAPAPAPAVPKQPNAARTVPTASSPASPAYRALAQLGCVEPRLPLSAADCEALEEQATEWLDRGATPAYLIQALTAGLPEVINSPRGFVHRRLKDKLPPRLPTAPAATSAPPRSVMMECTQCGVPGPPEALPDGLCRTCRKPAAGADTATEPATSRAATEAVAQRDVHTLVAHLRDMLRTP
ncbi:MarR family transcriptional regulator [Streptomyces finlayi]|uniref:MarR family transcriptional regulator n=2 Tax=Streptomyces finlayi TaxID=67296 RepID=A0A7G7BUY5_9ACTN|nr:MarR family transcriptional regulator [Streptomyces finlayi]